MKAEAVSYRAVLLCPGPDGEAECGEAIEFTVTDTGPQRFFEVPAKPKCPTCGRTDGFAVQIRERVS